MASLVDIDQFLRELPPDSLPVPPERNSHVELSGWSKWTTLTKIAGVAGAIFLVIFIASAIGFYCTDTHSYAHRCWTWIAIGNGAFGCIFISTILFFKVALNNLALLLKNC